MISEGISEEISDIDLEIPIKKIKIKANQKGFQKKDFS